MPKKVFFIVFYLLCSAFTGGLYATSEDTKKEILLRLPFLSEKNGKIISNALEKVNGITSLEACYELRVLIIKYDSEIIKDDALIIEIINQQNLNTTVEKIYSRDIPIIKKNYKISNLITIENKTH